MHSDAILNISDTHFDTFFTPFRAPKTRPQWRPKDCVFASLPEAKSIAFPYGKSMIPHFEIPKRAPERAPGICCFGSLLRASFGTLSVSQKTALGGAFPGAFGAGKKYDFGVPKRPNP